MLVSAQSYGRLRLPGFTYLHVSFTCPQDSIEFSSSCFWERKWEQTHREECVLFLRHQVLEKKLQTCFFSLLDVFFFFWGGGRKS